jgi:eukaryotic-like serine/threonine-protein kinase
MGTPGSTDEFIEEEVALGEFPDEEIALGDFSDEEEISLGGLPEEEEIALGAHTDAEEFSLPGLADEEELALGDGPLASGLSREELSPQDSASEQTEEDQVQFKHSNTDKDTVEAEFFRRRGGASRLGQPPPARTAVATQNDELASLPLSALGPLATMDLEDRGEHQAPSAENPATVVSGAVRASPAPIEAETSQDDLEEIGVASAITFAVEPVATVNEPLTPEDPLVERIGREVGEVIGLRLPGKKHPAAQEEAPLALPSRYTWLDSLGEGGQGSVELVVDKDLGRCVALKTLHNHKKGKEELIDLYRESRITGQLEHPHIMPIYDVGQLPDGRLYYTMPRLPGESLHHVLALRRRGNAETLARWPLIPLLQVLEKVCQGVGYAHAHGVVHRDLKPANILLGKHGEVLVVDWGIARVLHSSDGARGRLWSREGEERVERVRGSPPYMAPEQIKHPDHVSPAADVFCLGVILYEVLCRESPFPGSTLEEVVEMLCHERPVPPRERAPQLRIPAEVEEICLRSLEKFPGHRYTDASDLATALSDFLSGGKRQDAATRRLREAESLRSRYRVLVRRKEDGWVELDAGRQAVGEHPGEEEGRRLERLKDRVGSLERAADGVFSEAVWSLHRALADDPENREIQAVLGELYGDRYAEAEWLHDDREQAFFRAMLRQFDDGRWSRWLRSGAELLLETIPDDTPMALYRLQERDGRMEPGELIAPDSHNSWQIAPGRYGLAPLPTSTDGKGPSSNSWFYPVLLDRGTKRHLILDVRGEDKSGERFCFVPGGPTQVGGDRLAAGASYQDRPYIAPFAIARNPVTVGAYARFLDWLTAHDPVEARIRTPLTQPNRAQSDERQPITGISHNDALAYCDWLRGATGVVLRLPTAAEWEKAARGADGRSFPWGDHMATGYCASLELGNPQGPPPNVGSFPQDISPFGVEDTAGGVWEWTSTGLPEQRHIAMGGSIVSDPDGCRSAGRRALLADTKLHFLGFRVLLELD